MSGTLLLRRLLLNCLRLLLCCQPLRRRLPNLGGLDLSPIVVLLGIFFLERVILYYVYPAVMGF